MSAAQQVAGVWPLKANTLVQRSFWQCSQHKILPV
jgi:hypothetical protein